MAKIQLMRSALGTAHSLGTWLNDGGAGGRTIMAALGHADPKSSARYQSPNVDTIRDAMRKIAPLSGGRDG
jgi:integrase